MNRKSALPAVLASMVALASGCSDDTVTVVKVPADQIKDARPAPPPPVGIRGGRQLGPKGGMSAIIAPAQAADPAKAR